MEKYSGSKYPLSKTDEGKVVAQEDGRHGQKTKS